MPWETINQILGLATVEEKFCQDLLKQPVLATQKWGFKLTSEEEKVLNQIAVDTLPAFTQLVFDAFATGRTHQQDLPSEES